MASATTAAGFVEGAPFILVWILRTDHERTGPASARHIFPAQGRPKRERGLQGAGTRKLNDAPSPWVIVAASGTQPVALAV
jgi:hypothetical protein